ncbi:MAG TPA: M23 family metallopeptidase [Casimicrobiaceae bacterium]|nr:M23 family metallopeptidase [Casimicrobiaceae bacterium]
MAKARTDASNLVALLLACGVAGAQSLEAAEKTLREKQLAVPVEGVAQSALRDTYRETRGGRAHEALDIAAPRGTKVFAVDHGTVVKLFDSVRGGVSLYQFDSSGTLVYYYAHLDGYAPGIREGAALKRCDVIGYVGTTGNAPPHAPHLHFAVFALGPEKRWWTATPINPYSALRSERAASLPACR